ncbi:hypothetical protein ACKWTF_011253 [Chironomus riparius]
MEDTIKVDKDDKKQFKKKFSKYEKFTAKSNFERKPLKLQSLDLEDHQLKKYERGSGKINRNKIRTGFFKNKLFKQEKNFQYAVEQAARAEILLNEDSGYLMADDGEETTEFTQDDIKQHVDITSAAKSFKLNLDFGPYNINYTRNGRHLVIGGKKGHLAAFDWISKKLYCEFNVMEEIMDVKWLHLETMFAVAQKKWVHFYDNKGTEIHCVKKMNEVNQLEFLPYHFLLASGSDNGWLKWLDVSIGEMVAQFPSLDDRITLMRHNPGNATISVGSAKGIVSFWSPAVHRKPLATILCHVAPITAMAFNSDGSKLATAGMDKLVKLWDTRSFKEPLTQYKTKAIVHNIALSQRNVMALAIGDKCEIFRTVGTGNIQSIDSYLKHSENSSISSIQYVPYEDILGIGTKNGFSSILVPGCGEANFDTLEQNPFRTKQQRREHEVKALLEKIPSDLITLDASQIVNVDIEHLEEKLDKKPEVQIPISKLNEKKTSKRSGVDNAKIKQLQKAEEKQHLLKAAKQEEFIEVRKQKKIKRNADTDDSDTNVLDRFRKKSKK